VHLAVFFLARTPMGVDTPLAVFNRKTSLPMCRKRNSKRRYKRQYKRGSNGVVNQVSDMQPIKTGNSGH
jgi:hypothetical protein